MTATRGAGAPMSATITTRAHAIVENPPDPPSFCCFARRRRAPRAWCRRHGGVISSMASLPP
jgi:hypothetical protein